MAQLFQGGYLHNPDEEVPPELVDRIAAFFGREPAAQSLTVEMGPGRWGAFGAEPDSAYRGEVVIYYGTHPTEAAALRELGGA